MQRSNGTTRQEILTAIKIKGSLTAEMVGEQLGITSVAVRQHLVPLLAEGSVVVEVQRQSRGRPAHHYRLTAQADEQYPRRYMELAAELIAELRDWQGEEAVQELFARKHKSDMAALQARLHGREGAARIEELARLLSEGGYMARVVEGDEEGEYLLLYHNDPLSRFTRCFRQVCCHNEEEMLRALLHGMTVGCEQHIAQGAHVSSYRICSQTEAEDTSSETQGTSR